MFEFLIERRISEAVERGEFERLPGAGRPLPLDDEDPLLPEEMRMASRILKNAGLDDPRLDQEELDARRRALLNLGRLREV
jgi:hypothetical protein